MLQTVWEEGTVLVLWRMCGVVEGLDLGQLTTEATTGASSSAQLPIACGV